MERTIYDFNQEPRGDLLKALLSESAGLAATCGFIVQGDPPSGQRAARLLAELSPYPKTSKKVSSWPGTDLHGENSAVQYQYAFTPPVAKLLYEAAEGLYDWVAPNLPEDLHLLRQDGSVLLGCVAHERDAWLELDKGELARLGETVPDLGRMLTSRSSS